jgi:NitT/TauT family transport system substrate-binding protein
MRRPAASALLVGTLLAATLLAGCTGNQAGDGLRLGYFPNVTHAQALYGIQTGLFARQLGPHAFSSTQFNAGPTAMESLLSGQIDATYVGPGPLLNSLAATGPDVLRVIAGSASGGARFILRADVQVASDQDLGGKTFATPQLGNTQDLSLKDYLRTHGHTTKDRGGDVDVVNAPSADILALFQQGHVDGAWAPEPWATRLEQDAGGHELLDERTLWPDGQFATTLLVTTKRYLDSHGEQVRALLEAHVQATDAVREANATIRQTVNAGIAAATGKQLADGLLATAFTKLNFTDDPLPGTIAGFGAKALGLGLLHGDLPDLARVVDVTLLNEVLARHGQAGVPAT